MSSTLHWGIMGTGAIARKFAQGLTNSRTGQLVAVGSRDGEKAQAFTADFPARAHASYEALLADPEVEAVYISTPHPMHAEWTIRVAQAGKHVLCEKPLTMNAAEAERVIAAVREAGVFLMEAFMYRCHPQTQKLMELIRDGAIGKVRLVQASFSFHSPWNPEGRLLNPALGGGGILDVGCYPVSMSRLIAGAGLRARFAEPVEVKALANIGKTGVDEFATALLKFPDGMLAQVATGVRVNMDNTLRVTGEGGRIMVPAPWAGNRHEPGESVFLLHREGKAVEEVKAFADRNSYAIEADTVAEGLDERQSPAMTWEDSLGNMRTLDRWRKEIGLSYDVDA